MEEGLSGLKTNHVVIVYTGLQIHTFLFPSIFFESSQAFVKTQKSLVKHDFTWRVISQDLRFDTTLEEDLPLLEGLYHTNDFLYKCDILYKLFTYIVELNHDSLLKKILIFLIFSFKVDIMVIETPYHFLKLFLCAFCKY